MSKQKHLVLQHLENISGKVLQEYVAVIKDFIKGKAGVYALYGKEKLYYVGLASNLMNRLKIHLNDRHRGLWDRFSVYLTVHDEHMKELES
ncbi:MAG: GIY-YIG nuclease family protein, partial [Melioribacter sp.]|nr:GIY-YIG nuclease family protein [Melioribacter sp.]